MTLGWSSGTTKLGWAIEQLAVAARWVSDLTWRRWCGCFWFGYVTADGGMGTG